MRGAHQPILDDGLDAEGDVDAVKGLYEGKVLNGISRHEYERPHHGRPHQHAVWQKQSSQCAAVQFYRCLEF